MEWLYQVVEARKAANSLKLATTIQRNNALKAISEALVLHVDEILEANKTDMDNAKDLSVAMQKRLELTKEKIIAISNDVSNIIKLDDPINKILETKNEKGLKIDKVSVPLGVIGVIYESRPNVSVDIATLCIKSGNVCLLKGGKEAFVTNSKLVEIMREAISSFIDRNSIALIMNNDRKVVSELISLKGKIDLVVPRGSKQLIDFVTANTKVPCIETGAGVCHIYVDEKADISMALDIIYNAKVSNPSVCNAVECVLINEKIALDVLPKIKQLFKDKVVLNGCEKTKKIINCDLIEEFGNEYNDLILDLKVVTNIDEAIEHIEKYGTHHSDAIISSHDKNIEKFLNLIDSACVYVNASTRFTDGSCFGMGAELGISTQKLHARGPMALKEMTTYKYKIHGSGQIR